MKHKTNLPFLLRAILFQFALLVATTAMAHDFEVDGIYYNINDNEVIVTSGTSKYTGDVTIPSSATYDNTTFPVTSVGDSAFYQCSELNSVTIPNSVTYIGESAFNYCSLLNKVYSFIDDPTTIYIGLFVFNRYPYNYEFRTLHVPVGTVSAYQADVKWSQYFGSIVEMEPAISPGDVNGDSEVGIADVTALINYLLTGDDSNVDISNADVNGDSEVGIADVTVLINYLLTGNWWIESGE